MISNQKKVLVFGDDTQSFLATVRSLGRKGVEVHVVPEEFQSSALHSRYIRGIHRLPVYRGDGARWLDALCTLLEREHFDLIMPCIDAAILPLHAARERIEKFCPVAIPNVQSVEVLFDKVETRALAQSLGIPVARGQIYRPGDDPEAALAALGLPLVLKPRRSFILDNLRLRQEVSILHTRAAALTGLAEVRDREVLLESYFVGGGVGVSLLAAEGEVLQCFQHVRVHPMQKGSSGYRKSEDLDPRLVEACTALVGRLRYTGVVMFEFREDPVTREWILLEGNARPWGSLPLPVCLGIDFPYWWMNLVLNGERVMARGYPPNHYARNLTSDLYFLAEQLAAQRGRTARRLAVAGAWFGGFARTLLGIESNDTLVLDDPNPAFDEWRRLWRKARRRVFGRRPREAESLLAREMSRAASSGVGALHVEFVCLGNICRSPYAERLLRRLLPESLSERVTAGSSGSLSLEGRPSPAEIIERARRRENVDLSEHRSRYLTEELVSDAALVVVFDARNEDNVLSLYPEANSKLVWLGDFLTDARRGQGIADPFGKSEEVGNQSFGVIEECVRHMVDILGRTAEHRVSGAIACAA